MKKLLVGILYLVTLNTYTGENCPLPAGASGHFTGDPCHLATLNQTGSCPGCTLDGLDNTTLTYKLTPSSNLSDSTLNNANLANLDLSGVNFSGTTLTNATLSNCTLNNTNFQNANDMSGITLSNTTSATGAKFNNSSLYGANLSNSNFSGAIFDGTGLAGATLDNSNFTGASFLDLIPSMSSDTQFKNSKGQIVEIQANNALDLTGSVLNNVNFSNAKLNGIQFTNCVLNNVTFNAQTDFSLSAGSQIKTSFKGVNSPQALQKNNLSMSSLANPAINFGSANLSNVDFTDANFTQTNATSANFTGANLDGATMAGNFTSANFTNANFTGNTTIANGNFTNATLNTNVAVYAPAIPFPACVTNNTPGDFRAIINKNLSANVNVPTGPTSIAGLMQAEMAAMQTINQNIGTPFLSFYSRLVAICLFAPAGTCKTQFCTVGGCKCP